MLASSDVRLQQKCNQRNPWPGDWLWATISGGPGASPGLEPGESCSGKVQAAKTAAPVWGYWWEQSKLGGESGKQSSICNKWEVRDFCFLEKRFQNEDFFFSIFQLRSRPRPGCHNTNHNRNAMIVPPPPIPSRRNSTSATAQQPSTDLINFTSPVKQDIIAEYCAAPPPLPLWVHRV